VAKPTEPASPETPGQTDGVCAAPGRDVRIDALRGLAIALIVVQHLGWAYLAYEPGLNMSPSFTGTWADLGKLGPFWYNVLAYSAPFSVAVFAFLAGYLLAPGLARTAGRFLSGRFLGLMVPFLAWTTTYALFPPASRFFLDRPNVLLFVRDCLLHPTGSIAGPVWFLEGLFISSIVAYVVVKARGGDLVLALTAAAAFLPQLMGYLGVPVQVPSWLVGISAIHPYLVIGVLARRRNALWPTAAWSWAIVAIAAYAASFRLRGVLAASLTELPANWRGALMALARDDISTLVVSLLGIWMCICLIAHVPERWLRAPAYVGRYSLGIMGAQLPVIALLVSLDIRSPWVVFPVTLAASLAVSWVLDRARVTRMLFLGGRRVAGT